MRTPWSVNSLNWEQLQYVIYWKPAFNANCRSMKIYWWINNMQKLHQNNIFSNWNFSIIPSYHFFFRHTTNITAHANTINGNFISFDWMEIGCKLGSPISLKMTSYILMQPHSKMRESLALFWIQERTWWETWLMLAVSESHIIIALQSIS